MLDMNIVGVESECFDFRIVKQLDGSEWINDKLITPMDSLTPMEQVEYMETYNQLAYLERMKKKRIKNYHKKRNSLLYKVACVCNLL